MRRRLLIRRTVLYFEIGISTVLMPRFERTIDSHYTCSRFGSTVPFAFEVSGPSGFVEESSRSSIWVECLVSVLDSPSCLPDCVF